MLVRILVQQETQEKPKHMEVGRLQGIMANEHVSIDSNLYKLKLNLWLTAPKGATSVNQTSATGWQICIKK